ncbi:MAG TPA: hypothetical protein VGJ21_06855 [Terracidiphilus sp.]|jgi:hypothetical protein
MSASTLRISLVSVFVSIVVPWVGAQARPSGPILAVPPALSAAKTVFLSNGGADGGLFPEPFSGDPNRGYISLYNQLMVNGRYQVVLNPAEADLVMELHLLAPQGPHQPAKQLGTADLLPCFQLVIYDSKTHFVLWTITEPIEMAILQKTHDRNFDEAIGKLADDILALSQPNPSVLYPHPPAHLGWDR